MLEWLANTDYATWVREGWGWPYALALHALGTASMVGLFFIIGLRLIGLFRTIPYTALIKLIPIIWIGLALQAYSGLTLWMSKPARYLSDGMFIWKVSFVIVGAVMTVYFSKLLKREAAGWDAGGKVSSRAVQYAAVTTIAWAAVLVAGRLTAYLGTLYG